MASSHASDTPATRRDFLYIATGSVAAVGAAATAWPLIAQMAPDAATIAAGVGGGRGAGGRAGGAAIPYQLESL